MACLCLTGCCECGPTVSLYKPVTIISVVDMVSSILFVTYETANFGILTGIIQYDRNCTNCTTLRDYVPERFLSKFDFETYTVMTLIVLVFLGFIIEGSLYSKLKSGKRLKIHYFCKRWLELRLLLLFITIFMAIVKYVRGFYSISFDGVIDGTTKTYRVISMWIVKCYMREVEETVGVAYVKPPKRAKRGSLALK